MWKQLGFGQKKPQAQLRHKGIGRGHFSGEQGEEVVGLAPIQLKAVHFRNEEEKDDSDIPVLVQEYSDPLDYRPELSGLAAEADGGDDVYVVPVGSYYCTEPVGPQDAERAQQPHPMCSSEIQNGAYDDVCVSEISSGNVPKDDTRPASEYDDPWELRLGMRLAGSLQVSPSLDGGQFQQLNSLSYASTSMEADFGPENSSLLSIETYDSVDNDEMVRQMYEAAFDSRVKQEVENINWYLKHMSYPESGSSASPNSESSSTTPTHHPRPLPPEPPHQDLQLPLSQCKEGEKQKSFSTQGTQESPRDGSPGHLEQEQKNVLSAIPFFSKKAICGHQGVRVPPMDSAKPLSKLQSRHQPFVENFERDACFSSSECVDNCKLARSRIKEDQNNIVRSSNGAIPKSDSSGNKGVSGSSVMKFQSEKNDIRPSGDYDPPWDAPTPSSSLDEFLSAQSFSSSNDVPSFQSSHSFLVGVRRDPSTDCRSPGDYDPPWDVHRPLLNNLPCDPSSNLGHSPRSDISSSKPVAVNYFGATTDTRPIGEYDPPWDLPKHGKHPQPLACSNSQSDGIDAQTVSKDPRIPADYDPPWDIRKPCLLDKRDIHHSKSPHTSSDEIDGSNVKESGLSKSNVLVKKPRNVVSTSSFESYLECEQLPSRSKETERVTGQPKRPESLPIQSIGASHLLMPATRGKSNILGSTSQNLARGLDPAKPSSSKGHGSSVRPSLNLNSSAANVTKRSRKQISTNTSSLTVSSSREKVKSSVSLEKHGWYHGSISRLDAEKVLRVLKEGSFLVRNSESSKQDFSLSLK